MLDEGVRVACKFLGLGQLRTVAYVERESYPAALLVARMATQALDPAPIWDDVKTFDGRRFHGLVDILTGGYPCQPFSVAGKQLGDKDPRHLWPHIANRIREIEPSICFFENVRGHLRLGFEQVRDDLRAMGYRVWAGLFSADEAGANHERVRLFILAIRGELVHPEHPERGPVATEGIRRLEGPDTGGQEDGRARITDGALELSDPGRKGLQKPESEALLGTWGREQGGTVEQLCNSQLPIFAYGPGDLDRWSELLETRPDLAPATEPGVRLLADGLAPFVDQHRVEQLMCGGNGVVPLEAAIAFITLARSAGLYRAEPESSMKRVEMITRYVDGTPTKTFGLQGTITDELPYGAANIHIDGDLAPSFWGPFDFKTFVRNPEPRETGSISTEKEITTMEQETLPIQTPSEEAIEVNQILSTAAAALRLIPGYGAAVKTLGKSQVLHVFSPSGAGYKVKVS